MEDFQAWCVICGETRHTLDCYYSQGDPMEYHDGICSYTHQEEEFDEPIFLETPCEEATSLIRSLEALKNLILDLNKGSSLCVDSSDGELATPFEPRIEVVSDKVHIRRCPASTAQSEVIQVSSWEEEFGNELLDLPFVEGKDERFDPIGDLEKLHELLYRKPTVEPREEGDSQVVGFTNESMTMVHPNPLLCIKVSRPMILHNDDSSHESNTPREKAYHQTNRPTWKARHPPMTHYILTTICRDGRLLHYISCVRFGPGKFKCWWHDSFSLMVVW